MHKLPRRCPFHLSQDRRPLTVYPLNIPKTCSACHSNDGMAKKHGLDSVYPSYIDSIHGFALSKEGLLVAANCQSCHGSHRILSRKNPESPTNKANVPATAQMPCRHHRELSGRCPRQGHRGWKYEGARLFRLPHRARHRAAHGRRIANVAVQNATTANITSSSVKPPGADLTFAAGSLIGRFPRKPAPWSLRA